VGNTELGIERVRVHRLDLQYNLTMFREMMRAVANSPHGVFRAVLFAPRSGGMELNMLL
jgi:hypothetical protein